MAKAFDSESPGLWVERCFLKILFLSGLVSFNDCSFYNLISELFLFSFVFVAVSVLCFVNFSEFFRSDHSALYMSCRLFGRTAYMQGKSFCQQKKCTF